MNKHVDGISILGGEPLSKYNIHTVTTLCHLFREVYPEKTIWVWTGNLWENVKDLQVMKYIDVLVDGPFIESKKNLNLRFAGSENQRVIDVQHSLYNPAQLTVYDVK